MESKPWCERPRSQARAVARACSTGVVHTTACMSLIGARGATLAGAFPGPMWRRISRNFYEQSCACICAACGRSRVAHRGRSSDVRHHAFQPAAVLGVTHALRCASTARQPRGLTGMDDACAQRRFQQLRDGGTRMAFKRSDGAPRHEGDRGDLQTDRYWAFEISGLNLDLDEATSRRCGDCRGDPGEPLPNQPSSTVAEHHNRKLTAGEVLLVLDVSIGGDEHIDARGLSGIHSSPRCEGCSRHARGPPCRCAHAARAAAPGPVPLSHRTA